VRVVSLLPSATDIVVALGCADRLVGVTHSCDLPAHLDSDAVLTRTAVPRSASSAAIDRFVREAARQGEPLYAVAAEPLRALRPDVILTQALCAVCAVSETAVLPIADAAANVVSLTPHTLGDVFDDIAAVARALDVVAAGEALLASLRARVARVAARSERVAARPRVALLEWLDPPFAAGHWNPELVRLAGGREVLGVEGQVSRRLGWSDVVEARPDVLFIACCGFPTERALRDLTVDPIARTRAQRVLATDGQRYFSRPGPALVDSLELLAHALHPEHHPLPAGLPPARRILEPVLQGSA